MGKSAKMAAQAQSKNPKSIASKSKSTEKAVAQKAASAASSSSAKVKSAKNMASGSNGESTAGSSASVRPPKTGISRNTCRVIGCTLPATTAGYSRICYIKYWKQIKKKDEILKEGTLHRYIQEIVDKYPEKVVLAIRQDLIVDESYAQMIRELDLYGGVDELIHEAATTVDDDANAEESIDDIKREISKDDEEF